MNMREYGECVWVWLGLRTFLGDALHAGPLFRRTISNIELSTYSKSDLAGSEVPPELDICTGCRHQEDLSP